MVRITKSRDATKAARLYFPLVLICLIHPIALYGIKIQSLKSLFSQPLKKQSDIRAQKRGEGIRARGEGGTLTSGKKIPFDWKQALKLSRDSSPHPPYFSLVCDHISWSQKRKVKKKKPFSLPMGWVPDFVAHLRANPFNGTCHCQTSELAGNISLFWLEPGWFLHAWQGCISLHSTTGQVANHNHSN